MIMNEMKIKNEKKNITSNNKDENNHPYCYYYD